MGLDMWTLHSLWRKELEISRADYRVDKFTALSRYALIAGWVGSGTTACPPPEGDWMTSAPRLQATWGSNVGDSRAAADVGGSASETRWPSGRGSWF